MAERWKSTDRPKKGKNGLRERRVTIEGHTYSLYARTPAEMRRKEDEKRVQIKAGIYHTNETITLDQYFPEWKKQKEGTVKAATLFRYQECYDTCISPHLGKCKVRKIERRQVVAMMDAVAASKRKPGGKPTKRQTGKKTSTANFARRLLVSILNGAMRDDIVFRNVAATTPTLKRETPLARETIHRELGNEELALFFSYCQNSRYAPAFKFMLTTGVRAGECAALQWADVDRKKSLVHIRRTVTKNTDGKWIIGGTAKTQTSTRDIPMNSSVGEILNAQWNLYMATHTIIRLTDYVFPNEKGSFANENNYGGAIYHILEKMKKDGHPMKPFGAHAFRHTFASRAVRSGVPPKALQGILGHATLAMTMDLYAHINLDDKKKAMEKLEIVNF